jgi:hypothetical protein
MGTSFVQPGTSPVLNYAISNFYSPSAQTVFPSLNLALTFPSLRSFPTILSPNPINIKPIILPSPFPFPFPYPNPFPRQPTPRPQPQPKKLFQSEYTNYAWGYVHSGWYINDDGKVYSFLNKGNSPEDGDEIEFVGTIDPATLEEKRGLISAASQGPYSERTNTAFDAGTHVYSAFLGETEILLKESGDWSQENLSPAASDLVSWLQEVLLEHSAARPKFFQTEYTDFSWGYVHAGFYITVEGNLFKFQNKGTSQEGDDVQLVRAVDASLLQGKKDLVEPATQGPYSERTHVAYDSGSIVYSAFSGDQEILLLEEGDYTQQNLSSSAIELVTWLKEIEEELFP